MSSASHRKTKRIEAETALELLELLFIKTVGRPGDPLRDGLQKGEARFSQAGLLQFKAKKLGLRYDRDGAATSDGPAFIDFWIRVSRPPR